MLFFGSCRYPARNAPTYRSRKRSSGSLQGLASEQSQDVQQIEDRIHPRPFGLELPGSDLPQPIPGKAA